jgi:hypothetical protein
MGADPRIVAALGQLRDQEHAQMSFTPRFQRSRGVGALDASEGIEGRCRVGVKKLDTIAGDADRHLHRRVGIAPVAVGDRVDEQFLDGQPQPHDQSWLRPRDGGLDERRDVGALVEPGTKGPCLLERHSD